MCIPRKSWGFVGSIQSKQTLLCHATNKDLELATTRLVLLMVARRKIDGKQRNNYWSSNKSAILKNIGQSRNVLLKNEHAHAAPKPNWKHTVITSQERQPFIRKTLWKCSFADSVQQQSGRIVLNGKNRTCATVKKRRSSSFLFKPVAITHRNCRFPTSTNHSTSLHTKNLLKKNTHAEEIPDHKNGVKVYRTRAGGSRGEVCGSGPVLLMTLEGETVFGVGWRGRGGCPGGPTWDRRKKHSVWRSSSSKKKQCGWGSVCRRRVISILSFQKCLRDCAAIPTRPSA